MSLLRANVATLNENDAIYHAQNEKNINFWYNEMAVIKLLFIVS